MPEIQSNQQLNTNHNRGNNTCSKKSKIVGTVLVIILVTVGLFYSTSLFNRGKITVSGSYEAMVEAQKVEMIVSVVNNAVTPESAISDGKKQLHVLTEKVKEIIGEEASIKRSFHNVTPSSIGDSKIYQAVNAFEVTTSQVDNIDELMAAMYQAGATSINKIKFLPGDENKAMLSIREGALKDAKTKAQDIAKASNQRLGQVINVIDNPENKQVSVRVNDQGAVKQVVIKKEVTATYRVW